MSGNRGLAAGCNLIAGMCFALVSFGDFFRGRTGRGWVFAALSALQLALANALRQGRGAAGPHGATETRDKEDLK